LLRPVQAPPTLFLATLPTAMEGGRGKEGRGPGEVLGVVPRCGSAQPLRGWEEGVF
jgi:hypothetical protein